ncbi:MAG: cation-translocating P-type ATPase [Lachnospiraceae bacterium]|nr:cation-translocating P-type ATPase [Lachnospiraceae bacterium]
MNQAAVRAEAKQKRPYTGLTTEQALQRVQEGLSNRKASTGTKTIKEILKSNLLTYFNLVFTVLAILLIIAGSYRDLTFVFVIAANAAIGIAQEIYSKNVLDKMNLMSEPKVIAIRDGRQKEILSEEIVKDDCIYLTGGMQIPADAKVLEGTVHVNESMLTGESDEIEKNPGDKLLSGSFIASGECMARVSAVGEYAYASRLMKEATTMGNREQSEIFRSLNRMLTFFGILIIPLGIILFVQQYVYAKAGFSESIIGMVAALIGMIPEGIYLLTSSALAVSAVRLSGKKVLVHDLKCIETLARVDCLCVDKTGTITGKDMHVTGMEVLSPALGENQVNTLLADFAQGMQSANDTMIALQDHFDSTSGRLPSAVVPFSSKYKYSAETISGKHYVLGAPEYVLGMRYSAYGEAIKAFNENGCRVIAFAEYPALPKGEKLSGDCEPIALIVLENPLRENAEKTFKFFRQQGVQIRVISGDNPVTVSQVAKRAGIPGAEKYIDVSSLENDSAVSEAALHYTVFGRVSPQQKKLIVKALQKAGKTVAMTGDGVNDIIAMKEADCSIAMASGSEAASQASQIVLLDSDFAKMPSIVDEGRRVINNIQRAASLYLVKNIFSLLLAVFSVILLLDYPLTPALVSLISLFTIGIPSFVLAMEPNTEKVTGHFLSNVIRKALPAGITDFLTVSALVIFCREFMIDPECLSTSCSVVVAIVGFMILYRIMCPMRRIHTGLLIGVILGWLFSMLFLPAFFGVTSLTRQSAMLMVVFALLTEPVLRYTSELAALLHRKLARI